MTTEQKALLLAAFTPKPTPFEVPRCGVSVFLRPWYVSERIAFLEWARGNSDKPAMYRRLIAESVCDEDGKLIFEESDLVAFDGAAAEAIASRVAELNGVTGGDAKKGSSATAPTSVSASGSPAI